MMIRRLWLGIAAGAAGTAALNIATYADMALRGRPASSVPPKLAGIVAQRLGLDLAASGNDGQKAAENRKEGIGALLGYDAGLGIGLAYGLVRPYLGQIPQPVLGLVVALAAMSASDIPAATLGATDPNDWSGADWALDFGFHLVYGLVTVAIYDALLDQ